MKNRLIVLLASTFISTFAFAASEAADQELLEIIKQIDSQTAVSDKGAILGDGITIEAPKSIAAGLREIAATVDGIQKKISEQNRSISEQTLSLANATTNTAKLIVEVDVPEEKFAAIMSASIVINGVTLWDYSSTKNIPLKAGVREVFSGPIPNGDFPAKFMMRLARQNQETYKDGRIIEELKGEADLTVPPLEKEIKVRIKPEVNGTETKIIMDRI